MVAVKPEGAPDTDGEHRPWALTVAIALAAGIVGYLLGATSGLVDPRAPFGGTGSDETTTTTSTTLAEPSTLGDMVPGLEGLLITEGGHSPDHDVAIWRIDMPAPKTSRLPPATSIVPDAAGQLLAGMGEMTRGGRASVLYAGTSAAMWPVTAAATSFAWHGTERGRIAWLEAAGGGSGLHLGVGNMDDAGHLVRGHTTILIDSWAELIGWDEWGFLLRGLTDDGPTVYLVDHDGEEQWRLSADGAEILDGDRIVLSRQRFAEAEIDFVFTTPDAAATDPPSTITRTFPFRADHLGGWAWSPSGDHVAFIWFDARARTWRMEVWQHNVAMSTSVTLDDRWLWGGVSWSPDDRFIVIPSESFDGAGARYRVVFYDTRLGTISEVAMPYWVRTAFVRVDPDRDGRAQPGASPGASPAPAR
jgi:hypothetical protein